MYKYLRKYIDIFPKNNHRCRFSAISAVILLIMTSYPSFAQTQQEAHLNYIEQYKKIALRHQKEYGIPASITLAQGLLESNAGQSRLAKEANNHFGIKCGGEWNGKTISHKAEKGQECFRRYDNVEQSYDDHSKFLQRKRYEPLYKHKISDYKNWAKTLRKCGYATDPDYPDKLISLIERYELHKLSDNKKVKKEEKEKKEDKKKEEKDDKQPEFTIAHAVHRRNGVSFIRAREGDTYESIAKEFGIKKKKLMSYNNAKDDSQPLSPDEIVYLQKVEKPSDTLK